MTTPLVLDLDLAMGAPGSDVDDGFALALAVADPALDLRLVTTVNGNTDVQTATVLTAELLHQLGASSAPLHRGANRALLHPQSRTGQVPAGVPVRPPQPGHAVTALVETVRARPGELTLVAIGPLTNVALAMLLAPDFAGSLRSLVIMGGVFGGTTGVADMPGEFNVWSDPDAARVVLQSGVAATWVGLDVTRQVRLTRAAAQSMTTDPRPFVAFAGRYSVAWIDHLAAGEDVGVTSCALHDPLAVAAVSRPELLTLADAHLQVQLDGVARGVLVAERVVPGTGRTPSGREPNAQIAVGVDAAGFSRYFLDTLGRL
ncbi:nucleoside hydrolase [uncultured Friedmanniella sp.]|uniref:nucleoside hydrolase n=1 Tax=uncultured Friedmanniella sp. TaxID=335381 RepID=UPI0035CA4175